MTSTSAPQQPFAVTFDAAGLVPVVAQEETTGEVLLLAYMNAEALRRTLAEGILVLWSRSRGALWRKGEQSGNVLRVRELRVNCEGNSLLARVTLSGQGACHDGYRSCYYRRIEVAGASGDGALRATVVEARVFDPAVVYGAGQVHVWTSTDSRSAPRADVVAARPPDAVSTAGLSLERDARELYAAYERLRDGEEIPTSNTAKVLHRPDRAAVVAHCLERARQELAELRGVLEGTHVHAGSVEDIVLEAGQVGYWTMLAAIAGGHPYDAWQPHQAWLAGYENVQSPPATAAVEVELAECAALLVAAGAICHAAGVHPSRVVAADLAAMRAKHN